MVCETSAEMWKKFADVYHFDNELGVHMLYQLFYKFEFSPSEDIVTNISRIVDIANNIKQRGEEIPDSMLIAKILMSLPATYSSFITAWNRQMQIAEQWKL